MDWYTYRAHEEARSNLPLGRGIMAVNKRTGKIKMGDGHTLLRDLPELPASVGGEGGGAYRNEKVHVAFNSPGINDAGVRIATIQPNDLLREIWLIFDTVFDVGDMKYGTTLEAAATIANAGGGSMELGQSAEFPPMSETFMAYLEYTVFNDTEDPIDIFFYNVNGPSTQGQMRSNVLIAALAPKP